MSKDIEYYKTRYLFCFKVSKKQKSIIDNLEAEIINSENYIEQLSLENAKLKIINDTFLENSDCKQINNVMEILNQKIDENDSN